MTNIKCEFTKAERFVILTCSIERVFNTAIRVMEECHSRAKLDDYTQELMTDNLDDLEYLKEIASKLWNVARDAIFIEDMQAREQQDGEDGGMLEMRRFSYNVVEHWKLLAAIYISRNPWVIQAHDPSDPVVAETVTNSSARIPLYDVNLNDVHDGRVAWRIAHCCGITKEAEECDYPPLSAREIEGVLRLVFPKAAWHEHKGG